MDPSLVEPQPHLSTYGVLKETIKTTSRNMRLAITILLMVFISTSQLESGSRLALKTSVKDLAFSYWPVQEKVISFDTRSRVLSESESPLPSPWANRNTYYSHQRANPSNGYNTWTVQVSNRTYSSQRAYPSSYNGYTSQNKQARDNKGTYAYQRGYPSSYNGYTGRTKQASSAYSYQRAYPSSYNGYSGQNKKASSAYSYQRGYPSSYNGYTGQTKPAYSAYSYQRAYPSSYNGYTGRNKQMSYGKESYNSYQRAYPTSGNPYTGQARGAYSHQRTNPSYYGYSSMGMQKGAYSYTHQKNPTTYGSHKGETKKMGGHKDVWVVLGLYLLIKIISFVIFLFFLAATIYSSYEAYTAKVITLKDVSLKFRESWKRIIHAGIFLSLISLGFFGPLVIVIGLITVFTEGISTYVLYAILIVPGYFCYIHLAALGMMSFVVSVLENDYSGHKAIVRAGELMKGKRRQAYLLIVLFNIANASVNTVSYASSMKLDKWTQMNIVMNFVIWLICVIKLLMFVAFTVYYHERKMNQKEENVEERQALYVPIASDEV